MTKQPTNEKGLIKKMYDKYVKHPIRNTLLTGIGLATLVGTFGGNEGGLAPFYNKKSGTWGGINVGFYTQFQENSKFYGLSIGVAQEPAEYNDSSYVKNDFYGLQIGGGNVSENLNGMQIGGINGSENLNGMQIGVGNVSKNLNGMQIGGGNKNQKGWSLILGFGKGEQK